MKLRANKSLFYTLIVVLFAIGSVCFVYLPYQKKNASALNKLNEKRVDLTLLTEQVQKIGTTDNTNELAEADETVNSYFLDKADILTFISNLENIAQKNSVDITINLNEFPSTNTDEIIEQPISLEVIGQYSQIISFLTELEAQDYYLAFQQFNVSSTTGPVTDQLIPSTQLSSTGHSLRLTLGGLSYWR